MSSQITWQDIARQVLEKLEITLGDEQAAIFYDEARIKVLAAGEGSGKSYLGSLYLVCRSVYDYQLFGPQLYWIVGADFEDTRAELGDFGKEGFLLGWLERLGVLDREASSISRDYGQPCILRTGHELAGHIYKTVSGYDPTKLGREEPIGVIGCEVSRWDQEMFNRCYGRLARKHPFSWGWFSGSFESSLGWFPQVFTQGQAPNTLDIKSYSMPSWANPVVYPGGRTDPAILQLEAQSSPDKFMERYGGRPAPPRDALFPEFSPRLHVLGTPILQDRPVYLFVDPGDLVYSVLFVQFVGDEVWVVDEIYVQHWTHEQVVQAAQINKAWKQTRFGGHVMDIAGKQRHGGLGAPMLAWHRDTGIAFYSQKLAVADSVERIRSVLALNTATGRPRLRIDPKCGGLISELGGGPSPVPGGGIWRQKAGIPEAKNDHSCKALAYGLAFHFGTARPGRAEQDGEEPGWAGSYLTVRRKGYPVREKYL